MGLRSKTSSWRRNPAAWEEWGTLENNLRMEKIGKKKTWMSEKNWFLPRWKKVDRELASGMWISNLQKPKSQIRHPTFKIKLKFILFEPRVVHWSLDQFSPLFAFPLMFPLFFNYPLSSSLNLSTLPHEFRVFVVWYLTTDSAILTPLNTLRGGLDSEVQKTYNKIRTEGKSAVIKEI